MNTSTYPYADHRYPTEIISHAVWLYFRFTLSFRDVEELLAARGIVVSYETVRQWCLKFGQQYANEIRYRQGRPGDTWFLDEVFVTIGGQRYYLWRAVDQDGDVLDILVQKHRDKRAAKRFLCSPYGCVSSGWKSRPGSGLFTQVVITDSWEGNRTWASSVVKVPSPSRKQRGSPQVGRATMQAVA